MLALIRFSDTFYLVVPMQYTMQDGRALRLCIIFGIFASYLTLSQSKVNSSCWELPLADDEWIPKYFWRRYVPRETSFIISGVVSSLDEHCQICIRRQWLTAPGTPQDKRLHNKTTGPIYSPGTKFSEFLALIPCSIKASMSETSIAHFCKHPTNIVRPFLAPKGTTRYFHREPIWLVHRQPKRTKVRCQYYANTTANRQILLLGGDISRNPGPTRQQTANNKAQPKFGSNLTKVQRHKCLSCEKTVRCNQKKATCSICFTHFHAKCVEAGNVSIDWSCTGCQMSHLQFHKCSTDEIIAENDLLLFQDSNTGLDTSRFQDSSDIALTLQGKPTQLKIMHLNTQSMVSTFNEFLLTVNRYPLDIITLSETWLKDNHLLMEYVSIPGYTTEFRNRESIKGGGCGAYIKENINYKRRRDIENLFPELEHLWLEVPGRNKHSKALVGVIYRSNLIMNATSWLERFERLLGHLTVTWDGMLILTGDCNINMLKPNDSLTKQYQGILDVFGLQQLITQPTRVTRSSKTLIDHLITNHPQRVTDTGLIPCSIISDHDGYYACVNVRVPRFEARYKNIRITKNLDEQSFINDFSSLPLSVVDYSDEPDEQIDMLNQMFSECLERHAPLRRTRITRPPAPWLKTPEIENLQRKREVLRAEAHKPDAGDCTWTAYRLVRNKLKYAICSA